MKKVMFTGAVAALALAVLSQQRAAAQGCQRGFDFSVNVGVGISAHWTPICGGFCGNQNCSYEPYGYPQASVYGYPPIAYEYPSAQFTAPQPTPVAKPKTESADVQNIGYTYPAYYGYDYGYSNAYPYYQDYGNWYGR